MKKHLRIPYFIILLFPIFCLAQGNYTQINNAGFETFGGSGVDIKPANWNTLRTMETVGYINAAAKVQCVKKFAFARPGSGGSSCIGLYTGYIDNFFVKTAINGSLTTGMLHFEGADDMSKNYNGTKRGTNYHAFNDLPDSFSVWVKYIPGDVSSTATAVAFLHGDYDFKFYLNNTMDKEDSLVARADKVFGSTNNSWQRLSFPFQYKSEYKSTNPKYILINFATSSNRYDTIYIDDIELVYNKKTTTTLSETSLLYSGAAIPITVPFTVEGAMYKGTTFKAEISDANGSFSNPTTLATITTSSIIAGKNNLQINGEIPASVLPGKKYRIRVITANGYVIKEEDIADNGADIYIKSPYAEPESFTTTVNGLCNNVALSWEAPQSTLTPTDYNIYRDNVLLVQNYTGTSYTDDVALVSNTNYTWEVAAVYETHGESFFKAVSINKCIVVKEPDNLRVEIDALTCHAALKWDVPEGVNISVIYNIYRDGNRIASVETLEYTDETLQAFTEHTWEVRAFYDNGLESTLNNPSIKAMCNANYTPLHLTAEITSSEKHIASLTWEAPLSLSPDSYNLYRNDTLIKSGLTELTYADTILPFTPYKWCVSAVVDDTESISKTCYSDTCRPNFAPTNLDVQINDSTCNASLLWKVPEGNTQAYFTIYRNDERIASNITSLSYTDTSVMAKIDYKWCITAMYSNGKESDGICFTKQCPAKLNIVGIMPNGNSFKIYPNPANTYIAIKGDEIIKVEIFNILGQLQEVIGSNKWFSIDLKNYKPGVYVFKIYTGNTVASKRVVITK